MSQLPADGTLPSGTAAFEKRNISDSVAIWEPNLCIQCGQCSFACPHSVIRAKYYHEKALDGAPTGFKSAPVNARGYPDVRFSLEVYVEDCTGCGICVEVCPAHSPARAGQKGDQSRREGADPGGGADQYRLLRGAAGERSRARRLRQCPRRAVPAAAVRVLRRLRRLRRDALPQAAVAAVRRPAADRQRHRLLVDLWRQPAGHAVDQGRRRPRAGLVEFAVRGQCRVRPGLPPRRRQASRPGTDAAASARAAGRRGSRAVDPRRAAGARVGAARPARRVSTR